MAGINYNSKKYCIETDIENYLLIDIDDTFSPQVEDWIASAETRIDEYLGCSDYTTTSGILVEDVAEEIIRGYVDEYSNLCIYPRKPLIQSVSSISLVKGTTQMDLALTDGNGKNKYIVRNPKKAIIYPPYELNINGGNGLITSFAGIRNTDFYVKLAYRGGFNIIPPDIRQACVMLVCDSIMRHTNKEGLEFVSQGRVSKRWSSKLGDEGMSDFERDAWRLLRIYRKSSNWLI